MPSTTIITLDNRSSTDQSFLKGQKGMNGQIGRENEKGNKKEKNHSTQDSHVVPLHGTN
jgi:hypothetical protein